MNLPADFSEYLTQKTDKMEFKGCEWDFMLKDSWDDKLDGEWDPKKVVTESMFGKPEVGIWVRRGREGVYRAVRKATVGTVENKLEASGHDPFANEKKKNKEAVISAARDAYEKKRADNSVVKRQETFGTPMEDMLKMLKARGVNISSEASVVGAMGGQGHDEEDDASDEDEQDAATPSSSLANLFSPGTGGRSSAGSGSAKSSAISGTPPSAAKVKPDQNLKAPSRSCKVVAKRADGLASGLDKNTGEAVVHMLDGRARRIIASTGIDLEKLHKIAFHLI